LEIPGDFVEMFSLMTVETGALGRPIEVGHNTVYQELRISPVAIRSLLRVAVVRITVAVSIIRIILWCVVRVLPSLRIRRETQGHNSPAKQQHSGQAFRFKTSSIGKGPTALRIGRFSNGFSH